MTITIRYFISHSWSHSDHFETLTGWIHDGHWNIAGEPIDFIDYSIPANDPIHDAKNSQDLFAAIANEIAKCDVVAIPTGMYASYSNWIEKEIRASQQFSKPILAVNPWGQQKKSSRVQDVSDEIVGWTKDGFVGALYRLVIS